MHALEIETEGESQLWSTRGVHGLLAASHVAFDQHLGLTLKPDVIWQCFVQGLAIHINQEGVWEKFKKKFGLPEEKKALIVKRDEFKLWGKNDWRGVITEEEKGREGFLKQVQDHLPKEIHSLFKPEFSTTNCISEAASGIALMNAVRKAFKYVVVSRCYISQVRLEGTVDDWMRMKKKVASFRIIDETDEHL